MKKRERVRKPKNTPIMHLTEETIWINGWGFNAKGAERYRDWLTQAIKYLEQKKAV